MGHRRRARRPGDLRRSAFEQEASARRSATRSTTRSIQAAPWRCRCPSRDLLPPLLTGTEVPRSSPTSRTWRKPRNSSTPLVSARRSHPLLRLGRFRRRRGQSRRARRQVAIGHPADQGLTFKINPMDRHRPDHRLPRRRIQGHGLAVDSGLRRRQHLHRSLRSDRRRGGQARRLLESAGGRVAEAGHRRDSTLRSGPRSTSNISRPMIEDAAFLVLYQTVDQKPAVKAVQGVTTHSVYIIQLRNASKAAV